MMFRGRSCYLAPPRTPIRAITSSRQQRWMGCRPAEHGVLGHEVQRAQLRSQEGIPRRLWGLRQGTTNTTPAVSCTGSVGAVTCSSTSEPNSSGNVLTAKLQIEDQYGNMVTNTGGTINIDIATSGNGSVVPTGTSALSVINSASTTAVYAHAQQRK